MKVIIVGGVAGGATAAARLRRNNEEAEIIIFEKGEYISYANCGLPYYISGIIPDKDELLLHTPESFWRRFRIDVRVNSEVVRILPEAKQVEVLDKVKGQTYTEDYDKLILAPGAEPIRPNLPGIDSRRIFTLRNIPDTFQIKEFLETRRPERAVVVGAGFIGLEMAENLHLKGVKATIVDVADHVIAPLDYEMAAIVHQHLKAKGVEFYLKDAVKAFEDSGDYIGVELQSGRRIKADMVILSIGIKPETKIAAEAGLKLGPHGGIMVDEYLLTSNPDIYAVGDAIEVHDFVTGALTLIPLAGPANKQGRIAANNICGARETFKGTQGTAIVKVFDLTVAITGNNENGLRRKGIVYEKSFTHSPSHAGYYPGAIPMTVKLLFSKPEGKILGAQIIGYEGADKRMDVIATAIRAGMTVQDLEELELAYAPMYSSAKDPVNIAGFVASNILSGAHPVFHWDEVAALDSREIFLLDVRTPGEFRQGTIPGAVNIPVDSLRDRLAEIPKDKPVYLFCQIGLRGYIATRILMQHGFTNVKNLSGGYKTYQLAAQKQANEDIYENEIVASNDLVRPV
ncbi:MAG: FAD-dependent oxidoreductase [Firmicutes bacterium]|nr:FAD-dependent oxidoreductase [Bacillota bacterium]